MVRRLLPPGLSAAAARRLRRQRRGVPGVSPRRPEWPEAWLNAGIAWRAPAMPEQARAGFRRHAHDAPGFLGRGARPGRAGPGTAGLRRGIRSAPAPDRNGRARARAVLQRRPDLPEARRNGGRDAVLPAGAERRSAVRRGPPEPGPRADGARPGGRGALLLAQSHPRKARTGADVFRASHPMPEVTEKFSSLLVYSTPARITIAPRDSSWKSSNRSTSDSRPNCNVGPSSTLLRGACIGDLQWTRRADAPGEVNFGRARATDGGLRIQMNQMNFWFLSKKPARRAERSSPHREKIDPLTTDHSTPHSVIFCCWRQDTIIVRKGEISSESRRIHPPVVAIVRWKTFSRS